MARGSKREQALAVLREVVESVEQLDKPVRMKIAPVLEQAHQELAKNLREWLARENGENLFTTQRYRNALVAVRRARRTLKQLEVATEDALWTGAENAGVLAMTNLEKVWMRFGAIFEGTIQTISIDQAAVIAKGDRLLFKQFPRSATAYAGEVGDSIQRELAISRVKSETIFELANRLQRRVPEIFQANRNGASRLARSETISAYNLYHHDGIRAAAEDDPTMRMRWDASYDSRRCLICGSLDGQVVGVNDPFTAKWVLRGRKAIRVMTERFQRPIAHPNCRCCLTPWRDEWAEYARPFTPRPPVVKVLQVSQN